jgi:hypothetical protein
MQPDEAKSEAKPAQNFLMISYRWVGNWKRSLRAWRAVVREGVVRLGGSSCALSPASEKKRRGVKSFEVRVKLGIKLKSLILAQIERWRHA